jgi:hypothetical protein
MVFQKRCSGRCSSVGVCSIALASITAICCAPAHVEHDASGDQRGRRHPRGAQRVDHEHLAEAGAVGQGGPQQVRLHTGGKERPGPLQHSRDDQGGGLVAAGGAEYEDGVAVLGRQQPPEQARGAAQDHPARLGLAHGQQAEFSPAGPEGAGMLGRPGVARSVPGRPPRQAPQHGGRPARQAADQASEGGVHTSRPRQWPAHVGRPGELRVAPVLRQVPEDVAHVGGGHVQPCVAESQAGELAGGPHQGAGAGAGAQAQGQELVAGASERRGVGWPVPAGRQRWQGVMPHPNHPRPSTRRGGDQWRNEPAAQTRYHRRASWGPTP